MWEVADSLSIPIVNASSTPVCETADADTQKRLQQADYDLDAWVAARINGGAQPADMHGGPPGVDQAAIAKLITRPEAEQIAWVQQRLRTLKDYDCA